MDNKFSARISIVFKKNYLKPSVIEEYFPEEMFRWVHPWETCPIDGCMNCIYRASSTADKNEVMFTLLSFVNGCLLNACNDEDSSAERVRVTRKLLAGTRLTTFELTDHIQVLFNINWADD